MMAIAGAAGKLFLPALPAIGVRAGPKLRLAHEDAAVTFDEGVGVAAVPGVLPTARPT